MHPVSGAAGQWQFLRHTRTCSAQPSCAHVCPADLGSAKRCARDTAESRSRTSRSARRHPQQPRVLAGPHAGPIHTHRRARLTARVPSAGARHGSRGCVVRAQHACVLLPHVLTEHRAAACLPSRTEPPRRSLALRVRVSAMQVAGQLAPARAWCLEPGLPGTVGHEPCDPLFASAVPGSCAPQPGAAL